MFAICLQLHYYTIDYNLTPIGCYNSTLVSVNVSTHGELYLNMQNDTPKGVTIAPYF